MSDFDFEHGVMADAHIPGLLVDAPPGVSHPVHVWLRGRKVLGAPSGFAAMLVYSSDNCVGVTRLHTTVGDQRVQGRLFFSDGATCEFTFADYREEADMLAFLPTEVLTWTE